MQDEGAAAANDAHRWALPALRARSALLAAGALGLCACVAALVASAIIAGDEDGRAPRRLEPRAEPCLDAVDGEMCHRLVRWIFEDGGRFDAERYGNVTAETPFDEVQGMAHDHFPEICPRPCGLLPEDPIVESFGNSCDYGQRDLEPADAGCVVVRRGKLLAELLSSDGEKWDLPGGQTDGQEPARCTAHRGTFEGTGYLAAPRELLAVVRGGVHLYRCELLRTKPEALVDQSVSRVEWLDAAAIAGNLSEGRWRFPAEALEYAGWLR